MTGAAARLEGLVGPVLASAILDALREELGVELIDGPANGSTAPRWLTSSRRASGSAAQV